MTTSLTVYATNFATTTLTGAAALTSNGGTGRTSNNTALGTATGYGEYVPLGTASAWAAAGGTSAPTGKGMLWDVTTLEGLAIIAGTWTPQVRGTFGGANGNCVADIIIRAYIYNSSGHTYTSIGTMTLTGQTILSSGSTTYTFAGTSLAAAGFSTNDKLYLDWWFNVTSNSNTSGSATLRFNIASVAGVGDPLGTEVVTPGYAQNILSGTDSVTCSDSASTSTAAYSVTEAALTPDDSGSTSTVAPAPTDSLSASESASYAPAFSATDTGTVSEAAANVILPSTTDSGLSPLDTTSSASASLSSVESNALGASGGSTVALTVWGITAASSTLSTAAQLVNTAGGSRTGVLTKVGTATGYGEWYGLGTSVSWPSLGSIGSPSGNGLLFDTTLLEGQTLAAGNWTPTLRGTLNGANGNITADLIVRISRRSANGGYTTLGTCTLAAQTLSSSVSTTYVFGATSLGALAFAVGDKLYIGVWCNITANANTNAGASISFNLGISNGSDGTALGVVTPGYTVVTLDSPSMTASESSTDSVSASESQSLTLLPSPVDTLSASESESFAVTLNTVDRPVASLLNAVSPYYRGVNDTGAEYNHTDPTKLPGVIDVDYHFDTLPTFVYLASRGVQIIRYPFSWERLQPTLSGAFDATYLAHMQAVVADMVACGIRCIPEPGNDARYTVPGTGPTLILNSGFTQADLVNLWTRFSTAFANNPGIYAYDLMNEPHDVSPTPPVLNTPITTLFDWESSGSISGWVVNAGNTASLSVYGLNTASATLSTAANLTTTTGGSTTGVNTLLGTATGYGEWYSLGNSGAWAASGSIGNPSGHGFLWDVTTLEGFSLLSGNWAPVVRGQLQSGTASITADLIVRAYKRSSGGTYTSIGTMTLAAQTILAGTSTTYTFGNTNLGSMAFSTGDKLYLDFWCNVTSNPNTSASAQLRFNVAVTSGSTTNAFGVTTPGYNGAVSLAQSTAQAKSGTGSLAITKTYAASGFDQVQVNNNNSGIGDSTLGDTVTLWVYLPASAPDAGWQGQIWMNDATFVHHTGDSISLAPGAWTQLYATFDVSLWSNHRSVGVELSGTGIGGATVTLYIDDMQQGFVGTAAVSGLTIWENATQAIVTAIRNQGDTTKIMIPGYGYSGALHWASVHGAPWITDPQNNCVYEAHYYFDTGNSGSFTNSYATENANAIALGYASLAARACAELSGWINWLIQYGVKGYLGETGWPNNDSNNTTWNPVGDVMLRLCDANNLDVTIWDVGEARGTTDTLAPYAPPATNQPINSTTSNAATIEAHIALPFPSDSTSPIGVASQTDTANTSDSQGLTSAVAQTDSASVSESGSRLALASQADTLIAANLLLAVALAVQADVVSTSDAVRFIRMVVYPLIGAGMRAYTLRGATQGAAVTPGAGQGVTTTEGA